MNENQPKYPAIEGLKRPPLMTPGGGGTSGGMDELDRRLTVVEEAIKRFADDMKEVRSDIKAMRTDLAEMKGRVGGLPTTIQLLGFVVAIFVAAGVFRLLGH